MSSAPSHCSPKGRACNVVFDSLVFLKDEQRASTARHGPSPGQARPDRARALLARRATGPCLNSPPCLVDGPGTVRGPNIGPCQPVEPAAQWSIRPAHSPLHSKHHISNSAITGSNFKQSQVHIFIFNNHRNTR